VNNFSKPILDYTGSELKANCREFFEAGIKQFLVFAMHGARLENRFGINVKPPFAIDVADQLIATWRSALVEQVSREHSEGLNSEISLPCPDDGSGYPRIVEHPQRHEWVQLRSSGLLEEHMALFDSAMAPVDFEAIEKAIKDQARTLVNLGLKSAARDVASLLCVMPRGPMPKLTGKGLEFEKYGGCSPEGMDRYYLLRELEEVMASLKIAENETGIEGVHHGLSSILRELSGFGMIEDIPSRAKFGTSVFSATVFKNKTKFVLARDHADALLSFIALHGNIELPTLEAA